ncbi:MAG: beta-lactamase family protein [Proteobacteria bacterium]|nr:beta-lactamase family protein [Pseudomonadota bacterium]MBI3500053.1 beta-lactamase family protein [Pseudomonadota bacterium]
MDPAEILSTVVVDGEFGQPRSNAMVPWWSFSKTVLAASALVLVRDGKLQLDETFPDKPYTLRHLLQHTAGVRNYGGLADYHDAIARGEAPWPAEELLRRVDAETLLFTPGDGWAYSNVGYLLVRRAIEAETGESLDAALQRILFGPLGIAGVRVAETPADLEGNIWGNPRRTHPGWVYHGLVLGPVGAAALFLDRLMAGDLLPEALLSHMLAAYPLGGPSPSRPFRVPGYGLGVMIDAVAGRRRCIGHTGQGPGSTAAIYHFSELQPTRTVAAFAPVEHGEASQGQLEEHVLRLATVF